MRPGPGFERPATVECLGSINNELGEHMQSILKGAVQRLTA